jgi:hypothetical protein
MPASRADRRRSKPRQARRRTRQRKTTRLLAYGACIAGLGAFIVFSVLAFREPASEMPPPIQITRARSTTGTGAPEPSGATGFEPTNATGAGVP